MRGAGMDVVDARTREASMNVYIVAISDQFIAYHILDLPPGGTFCQSVTLWGDCSWQILVCVPEHLSRSQMGKPQLVPLADFLTSFENLCFKHTQ